MGIGVKFIGSAIAAGGIQKVADAAARLALTPANGDYVVQIDTKALYYWDGATWTLVLDDTDHALLVSLPMVVPATITQNDATNLNPANNRRQIQRVAGNAGAVSVPDIDITDAQEGDELFLLGTSDTNTVTLVSATNVVLNGSIVLALDTMLHLVFAASKYREVGRNN